ncbi:putative high-affinity nickel transport protein nic1 [Ophiocordyceps camponoti-floridani]|uniref:Nickel/cobalt efflux system n=1 Tax=Ophiocordyceps camponoti-floridani TaxID=2030778 RepID=A0A8H4VAG1_9HYPO|nr:putative high-affinity nickel transport protein nic1 [Ophiocordyceps camponoti-floridani]
MERLSRAADGLGLSALPGRSIVVIAAVAVVNAIVWAAVGIVLRFHPALAPTALLCYTLGLRHGLDADHISAIDLVTRRLVADGRRPVTVGTFFSLGHATVVFITCVAVAATSGALRERFDGFARVGGVIGTAVSAAVLLLLCLGNGWVLWRLVARLRAVLARRRRALHRAITGEEDDEDDEDEAERARAPRGFGPVAYFAGYLFRAIDRPWKMFPLGLVFGLGFDTSSEVALLGIASVHAAEGTSIWLILVFPLLFTAGMCLVDSADGALMMGLYTSKTFSRDDVAILYYSIVLTSLTIAVSFFIGVIQALSLTQNVAHPQGPFWDGLTAVTDHFDAIGGGICALFVLVGLASVVAYRPWRRHIDRRRVGLVAAAAEESMPETDGRPSPSHEVVPRDLGGRQA